MLKTFLIGVLLSGSIVAANETDEYLEAVKNAGSSLGGAIKELKEKRELREKFCERMENKVVNDYIYIQKMELSNKIIETDFVEKKLNRIMEADYKLYESCDDLKIENIEKINKALDEIEKNIGKNTYHI